jgi:phosphomannomutase
MTGHNVEPQVRAGRQAEADEELLDQAERWLRQDPDPDTRAELRALIEQRDMPELADRFAGPLEFGTAGLRGALGAGSNRMNRVVVIRAAAGLASYLCQRGGGSVVVGYDARHKSTAFAEDTADVLTGAGLSALVLPGPLPTPVLAFAVRRLGCVAGVMVTASHNPAQDNGYKVYLGDGSQIVPPVDEQISAAIAAVGDLPDVPRAGGWKLLGDDLVEAYVRAVAALPRPGSARRIDLAYTALHGVGGELVAEVLRRAGLPDPSPVPEQQQPDPDFPTVGFPNPEEQGAIDAVLALAKARGADLAVANDPDADRCAVAVTKGPEPRMLRGDEVGALLADHLLRAGVSGTYATTIVSSSLLSKMAEQHGMPYAETLTGFKWIAKVPGLVFGYEEALGYCVAPDLVRDKDGISALLLVSELAAGLRAQGRTLLDRLDDIAVRYGLHQTDQLSARMDHADQIAAVMTRLRADPPASLGGFAVESYADLATGTNGLPPTEGLRFRIAESGRVVVRPSGTEPKLKCYLEVVVPVGDRSVDAARGVATARLGAIRADLARAAGLPA